MKRKVSLILGNVFRLFFGFLKSNDLVFIELQKHLEIQKYNFGSNRNLFLLNVFFKNLFILLRPLFTLALDKKNMKGKKKNSETELYTSKTLYIFPESRENVVLK